MKRFIWLSFAFLALGFYELSGGASFDPEAARSEAVDARMEREEARLESIQAPQIAARTASAARNVADTAIATDDSSGVTRAQLDLVSFNAISDGSQKSEPTAATPKSDKSLRKPLPEPEVTLSLAMLEEQSSAPGKNAFAGNSLVATSRAAEPQLDIRSVKGTLVNMRSGPGTDYDVVDQLTQSTQVEILTNSGNGWVELRPLEGGASGWIAEFLLTDG